MTDSATPAVEAATPAEPAREQTRSRPGGWSMFLIVALGLHLPLFVYPLLRLADWLDAPWWATVIAAIPVVGGQTISRAFLRHRRDGPARVARLAVDSLLGVSSVVLLLMLCAELAVAFAGVAPAAAAQWVLGIAVAVGMIGTLVALNPSVVRVALRSPKLAAPMRFVQISDVHIGSRSSAFLARVIACVNELHPDFLCITGDFIDARGVTVDELRPLRSVNCPIYFSIGNHERYEDLDDILERLESLGVHVLRSETMRDGPLQIIGIDDKDDALQVRHELQRVMVHPEAFVVLMYHRPRGLEDASAAGVDLMLSGHTHNGQIIPFNLIVGRVFEHVKGLVRHGRAHLYVNQGTGTWGPVMRLGTRSEVTLFEITPGENY